MKKSISFILVMLMVLCMVPGVALASNLSVVFSSLDDKFPTSSTSPDPSDDPQPTEKPASSGIKVEYNGGNSFSTSKSDVPTSVEIDGVPVPFTGNGSSFTVGCIDPNAKWVTVKWNSTTVTVNFTPDVNVVCTKIGIPKTGDMPFWAAIAAFFGF